MAKHDSDFESLRSKCNELLKLNSALIVAIFALIRYLKTDVSLAGLAVLGLLIALFALWRTMASTPHIPPPQAYKMLKWAKGDGATLHRLKYRAVAISKHVEAANAYVNGWIAHRLTFAWIVTLMSLALLVFDLMT